MKQVLNGNVLRPKQRTQPMPIFQIGKVIIFSALSTVIFDALLAGGGQHREGTGLAGKLMSW
ncbi:MAG TPA: hypothetical protein DCS93_36730 [Microscillaceae bacterium]|nr:hypothetical protein [Microscillaceae bacterium]